MYNFLLFNFDFLVFNFDFLVFNFDFLLFNFDLSWKFSVEKEKIKVEKEKIEVEKEKIEVENKKIEVEKEKVIQGTVLYSLVFLIFFLFVAVVYLGLDGLKMQISRVLDECRKGGWFAGISHLFRRR